eukprot:maker-scaffold_23-snap-gene-4.58-mRNA-1 protein AED:0.00 eAED:0.00 QI:47/1/1/1/1/1/2/1470/103
MEEKSPLPKWGNYSDEQLRKEYFKYVHTFCKKEIDEFINCSKQEGLLVIFKCRKENRAQNDCAHKYNTNERWNEFRYNRVKSLVEQGKLDPVSLDNLQAKNIV